MPTGNHYFTFAVCPGLNMSLLCVFYKSTSATNNAADSVDENLLVTLLSPYKGALTKIMIPGGVFYVSSIAGVGSTPSSLDHQILIPGDSIKNPQSAWLDVQISADNVRFETDPLGMFPLWRIENDEILIITSEVKAAKALKPLLNITLKSRDELLAFKKRPANFSPYEGVARIRPGASLRVIFPLDAIEIGNVPLEYEPRTMFSSTDDAKLALTQALMDSAKEISPASDKFCTFLSGGIDSSTATALINQLKPGTATFTLGTEFGNEYGEAGDLANSLALRHSQIFASEADANIHFRRAIFCNEVIDGLTAETLAQLSILGAAAAENSTHVVTGYGADLLFGSMLRHELYMKVTGVDDLQALIERTCWTGEFSPFYAWSLGLRVHHLFWDPALMNCAFRIPYEFNYNGTFEKIVLRTLAEENGWMLHSQAFRKKYALTDGTQFNRVLSNVLGCKDAHAYVEKGEACIKLLNELILN